MRAARETLVSLAALLLFSACAGPSADLRRNVNLLIAQQQYGKAQALIEHDKLTQYGHKNMVLYYLDRGSVLHDEGKYQESDESFDRAETRMDELYTKSIHQAAGMLLLNDNTMDYAGEPFERALVNVFRALNYVYMGNESEALVESRKVELFLDGLNRSIGRKDFYKDDAFARYLDSMLYADLGYADDARISLEAAQAAYRWYASDYGTPFPRFGEEGQPDPPDDGELVFIHYNGVAPRKVSKTFQIAWGNALAITKEDQNEGGSEQFRNALRAGVAGRAITIASPAYVQDPFRIAGSEVVVDGKDEGSTVLMENISAIAMKTLRDRLAVIRARAVARATVKFVLAEQAAKAAARECDKLGPGTLQARLCRGISRGVAQGAAAATEIADTRGWSALPAQIRMARVRLPAGTHDVVIRFVDGSSAVVSSAEFKDVKIEPGKRTYIHYRTAS